MARVLTEAAVRRFRATGKRRAIRDGGARSLYLLIQPSGFKSWAMFFRRAGGRAVKLTLGPVDLSGRRPDAEPTIGAPLSLVAARRLAATVHHDRALGRDPHAIARSRRSATSFAAAAREFVEEHARPRTRRWRDTAALLGLGRDDLEPVAGGLAERWADRDVASITADDVHAVVEEARRVGVPGTTPRRSTPSDVRGRALARALSPMLGWLARARRISANPVRDVHPPPLPRPRDRALTDAEVAALWRATEARDPYGAAIRLLLLTGCRLNEVARLRWDEVADDGASINLPATRTKNHRAHVVPLSAPARALVAGRPRIAGCPYVFTTGGRAAIAAFSRRKRALDAAMPGVAPWRIHDLRRTCATGMARGGVPPHVVEACLNHVSGAKAGIAGVYNVYAYAEEKRAALAKWGDHVAEVVRVARRRRRSQTRVNA
jgi:integrase